MEQLERCQNYQDVQKSPHERLGDEEPDQQPGVRVGPEYLEPGECVSKKAGAGHAPVRAFDADPEDQERRADE